MKLFSVLISTTFLLCLSLSTFAQDVTIFTSGSRNNATAQYYREDYQRIGVYKVRGTPYVLKGANLCDVYTPLGLAKNLPIVFDAYTKDVNVLLENSVNMVKLNPADVDSFIVLKDNGNGFAPGVVFLNAEKIDPSVKLYMQRIANGPKLQIYKAFTTELRPAAMDVAQTNVREFEIMGEYYFRQGNSKELVKVKKNLKSLQAIYKDSPAALKALKDVSKSDFENALAKAVAIINDL